MKRTEGRNGDERPLGVEISWDDVLWLTAGLATLITGHHLIGNVWAALLWLALVLFRRPFAGRIRALRRLGTDKISAEFDQFRDELEAPLREAAERRRLTGGVDEGEAGEVDA